MGGGVLYDNFSEEVEVIEKKAVTGLLKLPGYGSEWSSKLLTPG